MKNTETKVFSECARVALEIVALEIVFKSNFY